MDGLRAKVAVAPDPDGALRVKIEWGVVTDNVFGDVQAAEEYRVTPAQFGSSYVSRAAFPEGGQLLPGTFWIDRSGRRHFHLPADAGAVGLLGREVASAGGR